MAYMILAIFFFSFVHFMYEGIIAPSLRMNLRYQMFALRDEVRRIRLSDGAAIGNEVLSMMEQFVANGIRLMPRMNLDALTDAAAQLRGDASLRRRIENRWKVIDECEDKRIRSIVGRMEVLVQRAFMVNAGGWLIYLFPIIVATVSAGRVLFLGKRIMLMSDDEARKFPALREAYA